MSSIPRLRVFKKFDSGAFGEVWVGEQVTLNRKVAVKVIKVEMADHAPAKAHALALANLNHQCVVTVHSLEEQFEFPDGRKFDAIVMEWLEGETLGNRLSRGGITKEELILVTESTISGLRHMHSRNVFHGDLHAGNIIIGDSFVKIIDVSATDAHSMSRFSTMTRETLAAMDVAYVAGNLRFCINRCSEDFSALYTEIEKLASAQSLEEVETILQSLKDYDPGDRETSEDEEIPESAELDTLVLKLCFEKAINGQFIGEIISTPEIVQVLEADGYAGQDILDVFEILGEQGYFSEGDASYRRFVQLSSFGMDTCLRNFYPLYDRVFRAVKIAVLRDGLQEDKAIAMSIGRELPVVQHFIEQLQSDYGCTVSRTNMGHQVVEIGAALRRELKGVNKQ